MLMESKFKYYWCGGWNQISHLLTWMSRSFIDEAISTTSLPIKKLLRTVWLLFWIMDLNFSGLTIILLSKNYLMIFSDSFISISTRNIAGLENNDSARSSVKLWTDASLLQKKNAFIIALKMHTSIVALFFRKAYCS